MSLAALEEFCSLDASIFLRPTRKKLVLEILEDEHRHPSKNIKLIVKDGVIVIVLSQKSHCKIDEVSANGIFLVYKPLYIYKKLQGGLNIAF